jgi:hypothetical protein
MELAAARAQLAAIEESKSRAPRGTVTPELGEILRKQRKRLGELDELDRSPSPCFETSPALEGTPTFGAKSQPESEPPEKESDTKSPKAESEPQSETKSPTSAAAESEPQSEPRADRSDPESKAASEPESPDPPRGREPLVLDEISPARCKSAPVAIESMSISPTSCVFESPCISRGRDATPSPVRECILDLTPSPKRPSPTRAIFQETPASPASPDAFADFCSAQGFSDRRFEWLAREAFSAQLLPGWTEGEDGFFEDEWTGSRASEPPLDAVYRALYAAVTGRKRASDEEIMRGVANDLGEWVRYTCSHGHYWHNPVLERSIWDNPQTRLDAGFAICRAVINRAWGDLDASFCTAASSPAASVTPSSTRPKRRSSRISRAH